MFTARSILSFAATSTATQCSAALPTIATTNTPTKNSDRPISSDASLIEPTRISDGGEHTWRWQERPLEARERLSARNYGGG